MALKVQRGGASTGEEQATQTKKETTPEQQMVLDMVRLSDEIKDEQDKIAAAAAKHEEIIRDKTAQYVSIKTNLIALLKRKRATELAVEGFDVFIKSKTKTEVPPDKLFDYFKKIKEPNKFFDYVSVKLTDAKKFIGEAVLKEFWIQDTETYADVEIKRQKTEKTKVKK